MFFGIGDDGKLSRCMSFSNYNHSDFMSLLVSLPKNNPLSMLGGIILKSLVFNGSNTRDGISIIADEPLGNPPMLNVSRPAVLRQYYGLDKFIKGEIQRPTFGFFKGAQSEGSDPK